MPMSRSSSAARSASGNMCSALVVSFGRHQGSAHWSTSWSRDARRRSARRRGDEQALVPEALLLYGVRGEIVVPHFLGDHDHPWLRVLLDEYERFDGRPKRELDERLREPLPSA